MDDRKKSQWLCERILQFRDGQLPEDESADLKAVLRNDPQARRYYIEIVVMHAIFQGRKSPLVKTNVYLPSEEVMDNELWEALAKEENSAEPIEVIRQQSESEKAASAVVTVRETRVKNTPSKTPLYVLLASAAAIFFVILSIRYSPFKSGTAVAVLSDSLEAVWSDSVLREKGAPLLTGSKPYILQQGYAQLLFNNHAQVTIQAPASFRLLDEDVLKLNFGQVYAIVPPSAYGFQICTKESKIIDLGTEFGIEQTLSGDTEIHVLRGKVVLVSKAKERKINLNLSAGNACKLIAATGQTQQIECREGRFVRHINSDFRWAWKGQPLDLADLAGGGSGFGGGDSRKGIDLSTGRMQPRANQGYDKPAAAGFRPVQDLPFIDGVFVPNGEFGPTIVSSQGHQFDFPKTSGAYWSDITPNPYIAKKNPQTNGIEYVPTLLEVEGKPDEPIPPRLLVHPNAGITFDLDKIRQAYPFFELKSFRAVCGLPQILDFRKRSEFWVLLDGQCVFHCQSDYQNLSSRKFEIPIDPHARFLTLAATDGGDGTHYDWCVFAQPVLLLERSSL